MSGLDPIRKFVVVAPIGRDGDLLCALLRASGYPAESIDKISELRGPNFDVLLGLVLTDEALANDGLEALRTIVDAQPEWSELPILLLTSGARDPRSVVLTSQLRMEICSLYLLDRPVRKELLRSAAQAAHAARMSQLQVRAAAERQSQSDEALRNTEKLAMTGRLAATMAHEVNNPLEALGNLLFLVENSRTVEEARSFSKIAMDELARISEIINHTLRFHRASAKATYTDAGEVALSALALFRGKMRESGIRENIKVARSTAFCASGELRQALVNLIGNALDAMPEGGQLRMRVSSVKLDGAPYTRITVADTGIGIRKEIRPQLFRQFFTTKGSRGTGLGLWLTRDIVYRNRGRLRFRSRVKAPTGTVFALYLPATAPREQTSSESKEEPGGTRQVEAA